MRESLLPENLLTNPDQKVFIGPLSMRMLIMLSGQVAGLWTLNLQLTIHTFAAFATIGSK